MADLVNINLDDTQNLLSYKSLLRDNPTITFNSSGVSSVGYVSNERTIQKEALSFKAEIVQDVTDGLDATFDFGDALEYTIAREGTHSFSFYLLQGNINANLPYSVDVKLKVYINRILTHTFVNEVSLADYSDDLRFAQSFYLNAGDVVNFAFEVQKDSVGTPNPNVELYFTGFQLNYGNVRNYETPYEQLTGFQSRTDTTNTQTLTGLTDNLVSFSGVLEENGGLTLMDSKAKITPMYLNDIIAVDFAFTGIVPVGTNLFLSVYLKVNSNIFRATTLPIIKGVGLDDFFSVSWILPVGANFLANGGEIYVNPAVGITIKNRYINVARIGKGR